VRAAGLVGDRARTGHDRSLTPARPGGSRRWTGETSGAS
jgi:hypothetical protein